MYNLDDHGEHDLGLGSVSLVSHLQKSYPFTYNF
jgi:hypothetical protein